MTRELLFTCSRCGEMHDALAREPAYDSPDAYAQIDEAQRPSRAFLGTDDCVIDDREFYVRGCIVIRLNWRDDVFAWGAWVSVTRKNYAFIGETFRAEGKEETPQIASRLANQLPSELYPPTFNEKARLQLRPFGIRPSILIEEDHPLRREQEYGMPSERLIQISEWALHVPYTPPLELNAPDSSR